MVPDLDCRFKAHYWDLARDGQFCFYHFHRIIAAGVQYIVF